MSEQTTEVVETPEQTPEQTPEETPEQTPEVSPEVKAESALARFTEPVRQMLAMSKIVLRDLIKDANVLADQIKIGREDADSQITTFLDDENTEDAVIQEYQSKRDEIEATLEALENDARSYVRSNLLDVEPMDDATYLLKKKELATQIKQIRDMKGIAQQFPEYSDDVWADLPEVKTIGRGVGSAGTKKPRIKTATVDGQPFLGMTRNGKNVLSFGTLAEHLNASAKGDVKITPAELSEAALRESGQDLSVGAKWNVPLNGKTFSVEVSA